MADASERIRDVVLPVLSDLQLELYDVEAHSSLVRVIVDRPGGVNLDVLADATRAVSRALDDADPIAHRYTLEVTSPGVERPLKRPEQFIRAVGEQVRVKTSPGAAASSEVDEPRARRLHGVLVAADQSGITVQDSEDALEVTLPYGDIAKARTVFEWGTPAPTSQGAPTQPGKRKRKREPRS